MTRLIRAFSLAIAARRAFLRAAAVIGFLTTAFLTTAGFTAALRPAGALATASVATLAPNASAIATAKILVDRWIIVPAYNARRTLLIAPIPQWRGRRRTAT